jgi:hypothetical protein
MSTSRDTVVANLQLYQYDPSRVQREIIAMARDAKNGQIPLVDPTNPVVLCMESVACSFSAFMDRSESDMRRLYSQMAQTEGELYLHMSDDDYIGRFATPSKIRAGLLIAEDELLNRMVEDPATKSRKVVIPRNTFFTVSGYIFSLQYPIVISQLQHEGLRVVYDVSQPSPLLTLSSNLVDTELVQDSGGQRYVRLEFDVDQFSIETKQDDVMRGKEFSLNIPFTQQYYYARVYVEAATGWQEIRTTYTDQVYDPTVVTAVLSVKGNVLNTKIPQVYTNTILASKKVRVDLYQTVGELNLDVSDYLADQFGITWMNYNKSDDTVFTAPMANFQQLIPFLSGTSRGGSGALPFTTLRERVMRNSAGGAIEYPISQVQIETKLEQSGYGVVLEVDNITERVFLATKAMPTPTDERLLTAAASGIETVAIDLDKIVLLDSVINNGSSVTITPETLYRQDNGITSAVSTGELAAVLAMAPEKRALSVSGNNWRYTPFHYVLDTSGDEFDLRAYHLDAPVAVSKTFVGENATTLLQVSTAKYGIFRTAEGYTLQIVTTSSEAFRQLANEDVFVQLAYIPAGEKDRAYLAGSFEGLDENGERIYSFDLGTNFNVTSKNLLQLKRFLMYNNEPRITHTDLTNSFDLLYSVASPMQTQWKANTIDAALGRAYLPLSIAGVTQESIKIKFGDALKTLWTKSRSYATGEPYQKHIVDVPMYYENDVYKLDETGSPISFDEQGQVVLELLHARGTPVVDGQGAPVYRHRKGDIVLDADGKPVVSGSRSVRRMIDVFLIDGTYWFADDLSTVNYRKELTKKVVGWLVDELAEVSKKVLDKTRIYFYPKTTMGMIDVLVGDNVTRSIEAAQSFVVFLQVSDTVYRDEALRKQLETTTIKTMSELMASSSISDSAITKALDAQYGNEVLSHRHSGLGGAANLSSFKILNEANRCSLRKRLVALPDGSLVTQEAVSVEFERMSVN